MGTLCAHLLLQFYIDSLETSQVFLTWSETCMWFGYNPQILSLCLQFELSLISQALLLTTYVDSMYLVRVTPPINFTFSDDYLFL